MHLLALTLQRPTAVSAAVYGNFSSPKAQEVCVSRQNAIELLRPDDTGKLISISYTPVFAVIRSIEKFRLAGSNRDYLVIGSDSGKISIVEFDSPLNDWKLVHCEVFGRTGCRRTVPGQYIAVDPKGRALMIASVEKQKFVYVLSRDAGNRLTISSPLEAHKNSVILFSVVGVDVGFENPIFAMIELDYSEADSGAVPAGSVDKKLTFYELDLGLNHVVRKWSEPIARTANLLLSVPGGDDGPSGVLICGENWISYKNQGHAEIRTPIPRRSDTPTSRGVLITFGVLHKQKTGFFFLVQSELGDLYKVALHLAPDNLKIVQNVQVVVFDSIMPANSFCITRMGLLYIASEFSNQALFQFQGLADAPSAVTANSVFDDELGDDAESAAKVAKLFTPSPRLRNLLQVDDVPSVSPTIDALIETDSDAGAGDNAAAMGMTDLGAARIYTVCGTGIRSSLRLLQPGVPVTEVAKSELPGRPTGVWSIAEVNTGDADSESTQAPLDRYIVVSFTATTIVLAVGDNVQQVNDSGFLATAGTMQAALMADGSLIQVHCGGIRHIRGSAARGDQRTSEWKPPRERSIDHASVNNRQVAISLVKAAGDEQTEIIYFELNAAGQLTEIAASGVVPGGASVTALDLGPVAAGRARSSFLAIGSNDNTVQLLSLEPSDMLQQRALMTVSAAPEALCLVPMTRLAGAAAPTNSLSAGGGNKSSTGPGPMSTQLYLFVGLTSGVLVRVSVDSVSGGLSDSRLRFLGPRAVRLSRVRVRGQPAVVALSTRPWLIYSLQGAHHQAPLAYEALEACSSLSSEPCPEGLLAVTGSTLRILTADSLGQMFHQRSLPLRYTPRRVMRAPAHAIVAASGVAGSGSAGAGQGQGSGMGLGLGLGQGLLVTVETDQHEYSEAEKAKLGVTLAALAGEGAAAATDEEEDATVLPVRGPLPPLAGKWASCLRLLSPGTGVTTSLVELTENEAAISACIVSFSQHSDEHFLVVGVARNMVQHQRKICEAAYLDVYRFLAGAVPTGIISKEPGEASDAPQLVLVHRTPIEEAPLCLIPFQGRLLAGLGRTLRLYDLGKKTLLRKCELRGGFPSAVLRMQSNGDRVFVGDMAESLLVVLFDKAANALGIIAEDCVPRYINSVCVLDYDTVAASDKFGNVVVLRVPEGSDGGVDANQGGLRALRDTGAKPKLELVAHYYLGEMATSLTRCSLLPGAQEVIVATTITGGLYAFVPLTSKEDVGFFTQLEMFLRRECPNLCQRDHLSFRSSYQPVRHIVDGDLCERFGRLSLAKQVELAQAVHRSPAEVMKKLEEIRHLIV